MQSVQLNIMEGAARSIVELSTLEWWSDAEYARIH
jgi:hypothetical protein